jgi:hypothetical protein
MTAPSHLCVRYWLMQNSWGEGWGDNGTIKLAMGSNMCGVANYPFYPHGSTWTSNADGKWHAQAASATTHTCASPHILLVDNTRRVRVP